MDPFMDKTTFSPSQGDNLKKHTTGGSEVYLQKSERMELNNRILKYAPWGLDIKKLILHILMFKKNIT